MKWLQAKKAKKRREKGVQPAGAEDGAVHQLVHRRAPHEAAPGPVEEKEEDCDPDGKMMDRIEGGRAGENQDAEVGKGLPQAFRSAALGELAQSFAGSCPVPGDGRDLDRGLRAGYSGSAFSPMTGASARPPRR